jgi:hypothetical protein
MPRAWPSMRRLHLQTSSSACRSLSFPGEDGTPIPIFTRLFPGFSDSGETNGRPALLGIDVRRRHAVALDRNLVDSCLRFSRTFAAKISTDHCYNFIYKKRSFSGVWFTTT